VAGGALQAHVYDAAYLELASRLALPLATLDGDLPLAADPLCFSLPGQRDDATST